MRACRLACLSPSSPRLDLCENKSSPGVFVIERHRLVARFIILVIANSMCKSGRAARPHRTPIVGSGAIVAIAVLGRIIVLVILTIGKRLAKTAGLFVSPAHVPFGPAAIGIIACRLAVIGQAGIAASGAQCFGPRRGFHFGVTVQCVQQIDCHRDKRLDLRALEARQDARDVW
jgi:hypothetical protein